MFSIYYKIKFWVLEKRIGPDMPLTHWMLYFKGLMTILASRKLGKFGIGSEIRPHCYLVATENIQIGRNVIIRPQSALMADEYAKIFIGDDVLIGQGVNIYVNCHKYDDITKNIADQGYYNSETVTIENNVWIGANAIILPGVNIGTHSVIAAGSVVLKDIQPYCVVSGSPAKIINKIKP